MNNIGILHPGEMGVSLAASAMSGGNPVFWVATGRSVQTRERAEKQKLIEAQSLTQLCQTCELIISICPPHAAEEVAMQVIAERFEGIYLDANAISPERAKRLADLMEKNKIRFIDGSVIGGPVWKQGETCLYLSGREAERIQGCFRNGPLETKILGEDVGKASALKMCYAAYSKGTTALLVSILATAEVLGIREELYEQWNMDDPAFSAQVNQRVARTTNKAWRFEGEMKEIASTFREAGLPDGFHEAAAEIYHRVAGLKNHSENILNELLDAVVDQTA